LNSPNPPATVKVIVQLNDSPLLSPVLGLVSNVLSGVTNLVYDLIPGVAKTLRLQDVVALVNNPLVSYVSIDRPVQGAVADSPDFANTTVGVNIAAKYGYTG